MTEAARAMRKTHCRQSTLATGLLAFLLAFVACVPVHAYDPAIILGVSGTGSWNPAVDSSLDATGIVGIEGMLGWKVSLGAGAYFSLQSSMTLGNYGFDVLNLYDEQTLHLEISLPVFSDDALNFKAGAGVSFLGIGELPAYLRPDWGVQYRFGNPDHDIHPSSVIEATSCGSPEPAGIIYTRVENWALSLAERQISSSRGR